MKLSDLLKKYDIPEPRIGGSCGDGWIPLVESLIIDLLALGWDKRVDQIKEKFGGLRFYIDETELSQSVREVVRERIREAEDMSFKVCETCGDPGSLHGTYWIKTVCGPCSGNKEKTEAKRHGQQ